MVLRILYVLGQVGHNDSILHLTVCKHACKRTTANIELTANVKPRYEILVVTRYVKRVLKIKTMAY